MEHEPVSTVRKRRLGADEPGKNESELTNLAASAVLAYSSEDPLNPVENILSPSTGRGSPRWRAASPDEVGQLLLEFDQPQSFSRLIYEVEEAEQERTQEVTVELSEDGGKTFRQQLVQEFTFSPGGATFEREDLRINAVGVTQLRMVIVPNKRGSGTASLTTLQLLP